jgi:hypothetical protein
VLLSISEDLFSNYQKSCSAIEQDALFKPILQSRFLDGFSALMFTGVIGTLQPGMRAVSAAVTRMAVT